MSSATHALPRPRTSLSDLIAGETRQRRKRIFFWIALAVALVAIGAAAWIAMRPKPLPFEARFRTVEVTRGDVVRLVRATGQLEADSTVEVGAEVSGRIEAVLVDFNDRVKKGQVLARFDRASLAAQVAQTEAALAAAKASLEQARVDLVSSRRAYERSKDLRASGYEAEVAYENALTARELSSARVRAAEAEVASRRATNAVARTNLSHVEVKSPIDGVVITRQVDPGQTVVSSFQTAVLFVVAADLSRMTVIAAVDEADAPLVERGQAVTFQVNAFPEREFDGVVTRVRSAPEVVQEVVTYGTEIAVENADLVLKPGMTASVKISTASQSDVLRVPSNALRFENPEAKDVAGDGIWVLEGGVLRRVAVQPGISDGELTAVTGDALAPGARVVVDLTPDGKKAYGIERT